MSQSNNWNRIRFSKRQLCGICRGVIEPGNVGYAVQMLVGIDAGKKWIWRSIHKDCLPVATTEHGKRLKAQWDKEDEIAAAHKWSWGSVVCDYWWHEDPRISSTNPCHRCKNKGYETLEDQMRTRAYLNHLPCV